MRMWVIFMLTGILQAGEINVELVNNTAYEWGKVWIAKSGTPYHRDYGPNLLGKVPVPSGGKRRIEAKNEKGWTMWQLRIEYGDPRAGSPKRPRKLWEIFDELELPKYERVVISVVSGDKWDAHYEMR